MRQRFSLSEYDGIVPAKRKCINAGSDKLKQLKHILRHFATFRPARLLLRDAEKCLTALQGVSSMPPALATKRSEPNAPSGVLRENVASRAPVASRLAPSAHKLPQLASK